MRALRCAVGFLYRLGPMGDDVPPRWVDWLVPLGLAVGVLLAGLTGVAWRRWYSERIAGLWLPVLPMMLLYWLGPGVPLYLGWGRTILALRASAGLRLGEPSPGNRETFADGSAGGASLTPLVLALLAAGLTHYVATATLSTDLAMISRPMPFWLSQLIFPRKVYGGLVLMAVWGHASVLLTACLGRADPAAEPTVHQLFAFPVWRKMAWGLAAPAGVSALFVTGWKWTGDWTPTIALGGATALAMAVILFGAMMLFGWLLGRRGQGHNRGSLLAAALLGELVFLAVFHALVR